MKPRADARHAGSLNSTGDAAFRASAGAALHYRKEDAARGSIAPARTDPPLKNAGRKMPDLRKKSEKTGATYFELDFGFGKVLLGTLFDSDGRLIELADGAGGEINRQGASKAKGAKELRGVYGFSICTAVGNDGRERAMVQAFGNIKKTPHGAVVQDTREPLVDVFEENGSVQVIAEMPGVEESEIHYLVKDDVLILLASGERKYRKGVLLPRPVDAENVTMRYRNGVLELTLRSIEPQGEVE